ncbi:MAG: hypothetical protein H0X28_06020 [Solirubrobacterales bacterium]|nr:hypothetical protein [Solirubrobacterales bacterium]
MDVWEYFQTREREITDCSMSIFPGIHPFAAEADNDQRGRIFCTLSFHGYSPEDVYFQMHEEITVRASGVTRSRYAYFLVIGANEIGGYERHASHSPPVHKHCSGTVPHERSPSRAISFKDAANEAWRYVAEFATPEGVGAPEPDPDES